MTFRVRMIVFVSLLLAGAQLITASFLMNNARQAMLDEQAEAGRVLARMLARTAFIVRSFPEEMEDVLAEQMVIDATIAAHFVAAGEAAGWTSEQINERLKEIVASTTLSEFWITDENGRAYLRNATEIDFAFEPDPNKNPQSAIFFKLITGEEKVVIQPAQRRDFDGKIFKYVGVGGVDRPRIVQVGYEASILAALRERVSLDRLSQELVASGDIRAIRVVNAGVETVVYQAGEGLPDVLSTQDVTNLQQAVKNNAAQDYLEGSSFKFIEPIHGTDENTPASGAVMVYLPTDRLDAVVRRYTLDAVVASAGILLVGALVSLLFSLYITRPLGRFQQAAEQVAGGNYHSDVLNEVVTRKDELGKLGRVFDGMAREVTARDRRLKLLRVIIPMGVSLSVEKDFNRLLETIVVEAQKITRADAGSLYLLTEQHTLRFMILRNETLKLFFGGTTGIPPAFPEVPLYQPDGSPNHHHLASYVALNGKSVMLKDAYQEDTRFDLSGTRAFDARTGYHSQSFLTVPLKDTDDRVIGVLQLINAHDNETGAVIPFAEDEVIDSLGLITSAALSAYIREESLRQEINKLRIEIDMGKQNRQVEEITESDYFQQLQVKAQKMREKRKE